MDGEDKNNQKMMGTLWEGAVLSKKRCEIAANMFLPWNPGWFIGILTMADYNPYIAG